MKLDQLAEIVEDVRTNYPQITRELTLEAMYKLYKKYLLNEEYEHVMANLSNHIRTSDYPPKISDLVKQQPKQPKSIVPSHSETMAYLDSLEPKERLSRAEILDMARKVGLRV